MDDNLPEPLLGRTAGVVVGFFLLLFAIPFILFIVASYFVKEAYVKHWQRSLLIVIDRIEAFSDEHAEELFYTSVILAALLIWSLS